MAQKEILPGDLIVKHEEEISVFYMITKIYIIESIQQVQIHLFDFQNRNVYFERVEIYNGKWYVSPGGSYWPGPGWEVVSLGQ